MDELVFQRETLRRACEDLVQDLGKAADKYNPEETIPVADVTVALLLQSFWGIARQYTEAIRAHAANLDPRYAETHDES